MSSVAIPVETVSQRPVRESDLDGFRRQGVGVGVATGQPIAAAIVTVHATWIATDPPCGDETLSLGSTSASAHAVRRARRQSIPGTDGSRFQLSVLDALRTLESLLRSAMRRSRSAKLSAALMRSSGLQRSRSRLGQTPAEN